MTGPRHSGERRAALVAYLGALGFTAEEMADAERRGRLFGLAGDALGWSGPPRFNLRDAAATLGVTVGELERTWTMLGLRLEDADAPTLSRADVDALGTCVAMRDQLGDLAEGFLRVLGVTMARLAEAESSMIRAARPDVWLDHSGDELTTAQAWRAAAEFIPRVGALIDTIHRHHLVSARTFLEDLGGGPTLSLVCGVGFTDLSGFTALTRLLSPVELTELVTGFVATVTDAVHAAGGRVVKFIGDAVMWVSATPDLLVSAAIDLVDHPRAIEAGVRVRAGLGYGEILAVNGDYFGNPVNLAARLVSAADPSQILVAENLRVLLPDWPARALDPLTLKGFDGPIAAYELGRASTR